MNRRWRPRAREIAQAWRNTPLNHAVQLEDLLEAAMAEAHREGAREEREWFVLHVYAPHCGDFVPDALYQNLLEQICQRGQETSAQFLDRVQGRDT